MSIVEYVFSAIGILVVIGGFVYGIYDSYFQTKDGSSDKDSSNIR